MERTQELRRARAVDLVAGAGEADAARIQLRAFGDGDVGVGEGAAGRRIALQQEQRTMDTRPERFVIEAIEPAACDQRCEDIGIDPREAAGAEFERGTVANVPKTLRLAESDLSERLGHLREGAAAPGDFLHSDELLA